MSRPKPSVRAEGFFLCSSSRSGFLRFAIVHAAGRNGHANDNSCPSGSSMWKYRSPHEAFCGFSGLNPSSMKRLQSASTSSTWKTSRPQPSTDLPCSRLRMAEFALFQIENGRVRVLRTQGRKPYSFSAVKKLHAEYIPIELHGGFHVRDPKSHRRNLLHHDCHDASSLPSPRTRFSRA